MIISIHIPRCAGTTFLHVLRRMFMVMVDDFYEARPYNKLVNCIHGHFTSTKYDKIYPDAHKVTWVREPIERLASNYVLDKNADWSITDEDYFSQRLRNGEMSFFEYANILANGMNIYLPEPIENYDFIGEVSLWEICLDSFLKRFTYRKYLDGVVHPANVQNHEEVQGLIDNLTIKQINQLKRANGKDYELFHMVQKHWRI